MSAIPFPRFGDVAHVGHVELLTARPEESLAFFTSVVGLHETGRSGGSVYLRAWGDYERHTLKLTAHTTSGLGHLGLRVRDQATLERFVARLAEREVSGRWTEDEAHGPAYRFATPDGHAVELYSETQRFMATPEVTTAFKNQPQRYVAPGHRAASPGPRQHSRACCCSRPSSLSGPSGSAPDRADHLR